MKVQATIVDDIDAAVDIPGAIVFRPMYGEDPNVPVGLGFRCPCGCKREGWLPFRPAASPSWEWDGDREAPTLHPSILQVGGCRWHGYLRAGVFEEC